MYSHALLLRLFLSNSFFSVHVALQYLRLYADNIGITHYLTGRLKELPTQELWDVWGFICHLLVAEPSQSVALECFIIERAEQSTHIAMLTLWFMQTSLHDLASNRRDTPSFVVCQRVLHKCHEIIFGDLPPPVPAPYSSLVLSPRSRFLRKKVKPRIEPALVGMGCVLAGVPGMPQLTDLIGKVAIAQGRWDGVTVKRPPVNFEAEEDAAPGAQNSKATSAVDEESEDGIDEDDLAKDLNGVAAGVSGSPSKTLASPFVYSGNLSHKPRECAAGAAHTTPALPLHPVDAPKISRLSDDPLGQSDGSLPSPPRYKSSPTISDVRRQPVRASLTSADFFLQKYDTHSRRQLLRSHYLQGEVQFIISLETIANRLLVVPRPARVSALRAELTNLNHKLPAEVCIPLWCDTSDIERRTDGIPEPHHRVVRIPPGESVVLNSAERAPYLLIVEILHGDLDFDPTRGANNEILRRMVLKEIGRRGTLTELPDWADGLVVDSTLRDDVALDASGTDHADMPSMGTIIPATPIDPPVEEEEEEVDVVEQLYGTDLSLRSQAAALNDSIALPAVRKNKVLDAETWSKAVSAPSSPALQPQSQNPPLEHIRTLSETRDFNVPLADNHPPYMSLSAANSSNGNSRTLSLEDYSERMRTAAVMLAQLNSNVIREPVTMIAAPTSTSASSEPNVPNMSLSWIPGSSWLPGMSAAGASAGQGGDLNPPAMRMRLQRSEAQAIRDRIMREMLSLEEERMERMRTPDEGGLMNLRDIARSAKTVEDEGIIRRELNKADPSAAVFRESWATKKSRIKAGSPYGHLANWDCVSVIVKTGADLRQEQLAVQLIREFERIWKDENCACWVRHFRILITGPASGLVETVTDAVSIHSLKKAEYARRLAEGRLGYVTLLDHFISAFGDPSSAKFARAQRNFAKSLAGYSIITYLLQIKDRHNGNILIDRDGHLLHIDFGFMLSNSPGNIGFEAAPFKLPSEYVEVLGGVDSEPFREFKQLFREGFEAARKHCDRITTLVELMQKDSTLPCFAAFKEQTAENLRERFQPSLTHSLVGEHIDRLIMTSLGSAWTRLYDSYQYYSQSIL